MLKSLKLLSLLSGLFLLISCTPDAPNVVFFEEYRPRLVTDPKTGHLLLKPSPLCMKMIGEPTCGHGVYTLSQEEIWVGEDKKYWFEGKPWSQVRDECVLVPAVESMVPIQKYIINSCKKMNCNDAVTKFKIKLDALNGIKAVIDGK